MHFFHMVTIPFLFFFRLSKADRTRLTDMICQSPHLQADMLISGFVPSQNLTESGLIISLTRPLSTTLQQKPQWHLKQHYTLSETSLRYRLRRFPPPRQG